MKNKLSLSVSTPCSERWAHFTPTSRGGFCTSCHKDVVDFTKMSDAEILAFFTQAPAQSCGRFRPNQLKSYSYTQPTNSVAHSSWHVVQTGVLGLLLFLGSKQGFSKQLAAKTTTHFSPSKSNEQGAISTYNAGGLGKMIKGTVRDEFKQPIAGVTILLKGTTVGTATDEAGNFKFPQELKEGEVLVFEFIGFESKEYVVSKQSDSMIEIAMVTLYMDIMGEVAIDSPYTAEPKGIRTWWHQVKSLF